MTRSVVASMLTLCMVLAAMPHAVASASKLACRCFGEIHCVTWGGVWFDYQGWGEYEMATGPRFQITSKLDTCRPPTAGQYSCIRSSRVKIWDPQNAAVVDFIEHGQRMPLDPVQTADAVNLCSAANCTNCLAKSVDDLVGAGTTTLNFGLSVKWNAATKELIIEPPANCIDCPRVVLGPWYLNVYVEDKASLYGQIKGLCGAFPSTPNAFTGRNGTVFVSNAVATPVTKYVSQAVNDYATTFWVDHTNIPKTCANDAAPSPPFVAGSTTATVTFADADEAGVLTEKCQSASAKALVGKTSDTQYAATVGACVFDAAVMRTAGVDMALAGPGSLAERQRFLSPESESSSMWNNSNIAILALAIALGVVVLSLILLAVVRHCCCRKSSSPGAGASSADLPLGSRQNEDPQPGETIELVTPTDNLLTTKVLERQKLPPREEPRRQVMTRYRVVSLEK